MDITAITGGYTKKVNVSDTLETFKLPLQMTAFVHLLGTYKYAAFGWYNDPYASNSSLRDNLDALYRHLGAHSMGLVRDREGLPHVFHACCRASMLASIFYKEFSPIQFKLTGFNLLEADNWAQFITHAELLSLTKYLAFEEHGHPDTAQVMIALTQLTDYLFNKDNKYPKDAFNLEEVTPVDKFYGVLFSFVKEWWYHYGSPELIKVDHSKVKDKSIEELQANEQIWIDKFFSDTLNLGLDIRTEIPEKWSLVTSEVAPQNRA